VAKKYRVNDTVRFVNRIMVGLNRWNISPPHTYVLTVRGRNSGRPYSLPVRLIERDGKRWLVAPYGEVEWVKNARAVGEVSLSRGKITGFYEVHPLGPRESAPILKEYINRVEIVRPYFDTQPESSLEAFEAEAPRHPVFLLEARQIE
jgi:deazaflavin-dependent oxidoreductase (nitroreductase family)